MLINSAKLWSCLLYTAAQVLEEVLMKGWMSEDTPVEIVHDVANRSEAGMKIALEAVIDVKSVPHKETVQKFQSNCGIVLFIS